MLHEKTEPTIDAVAKGKESEEIGQFSFPMNVFQIAEASASFYQNESLDMLNDSNSFIMSGHQLPQSNRLDSNASQDRFVQRTRSQSFTSVPSSVHGDRDSRNSSRHDINDIISSNNYSFGSHLDAVSIGRRLFDQSNRPFSAAKGLSGGGSAVSSGSSANMRIFKSPVKHQRHANVNRFDPQTLRWSPTKVKSKLYDRFQSHTDVLWAKKVNGVFNQRVKE